MNAPARLLTAGIIALCAVSCGRSDRAAAPAPTAPSGLFGQSLTPPSTSVTSIWGFVLDTGFRIVPGARIEVVDGSPDAGTGTTSGANGEFTLVGTFTEATTFRATKDGYVTATQRWSCSVGTCPGVLNARPWVPFYLAVPTPPVNLAGQYTMTFTADPACTDLPPEARTQTFAASIAPGLADARYTVTTGVPPFVTGLNRFEIGVADNYLGIAMHGGHDPALVERTGQYSYVALSGVGSASMGSAATIDASFDGWVEYCEPSLPMIFPYECRPAWGTTKVRCESKAHRLTLTRQ